MTMPAKPPRLLVLTSLAIALALAMALGGLAHHVLCRVSPVAPSTGPIDGLPTDLPPAAILLDADVPPAPSLSLTHWLQRAEADPLGTAPSLTEALSQLDPIAIARLGAEWVNLEREPPWSLAERLVHDALFFSLGLRGSPESARLH